MRRTGPSPQVCGIVMTRDAGHCRRCGAIGQQIHHRRPRGMGGSRDPLINNPANLVLLCADCHRWIESYRFKAMAAGWLLSKHVFLELASEVPLIALDGSVFTLTEEGDSVPVLRGVTA